MYVVVPRSEKERSEGNPLDLNNLPEDYIKDGKQILDDSSSSSERETETLNKARHLVFTSDLSPGAHQPGYLSSGQPILHENIMGDPTMPFRSIYPTRMFSGSSPPFQPPPQGLSPLPPPPPPGMPLPPPQPYLYTSSSRIGSIPTQYHGQFVNDYFVAGHVHPGNSRYSHSKSSYSSAPQDTNFTCLGTPVGHGLPCSRGQDGVDDVRDKSQHNQEEGLD
ncbi:Hypothetical predicted protein [Olea europaea subsp. europaea]|uniref:Uncharacterized protein n=1 Tax=Olea europaea subsp. europaea TaxID=158383 RepID=A0A8S0T4B4_OLEEU|nr:Hypothetical predicted protein [Olea europaea subsp. europaea]